MSAGGPPPGGATSAPRAGARPGPVALVPYVVVGFAWLPLAFVPGVQLDVVPLATTLAGVAVATLLVVAGTAALARGRAGAGRVVALCGGATLVAWAAFGSFGLAGLNRLADRTPLGVPVQLPIVARSSAADGHEVEVDTGTRRLRWSAPPPIHATVEPGRDCARVHAHPGALGARWTRDWRVVPCATPVPRVEAPMPRGGAGRRSAP